MKKIRQFLKDIDSKYDLCKRYKKSKPRPVIGFSLARDFNDVIAMDLKHF